MVESGCRTSLATEAFESLRVMRYFFWRLFGIESEGMAVDLVPLVTAVTLSIALCVFPLMAAEKRLTALAESH